MSLTFQRRFPYKSLRNWDTIHSAVKKKIILSPFSCLFPLFIFAMKILYLIQRLLHTGFTPALQASQNQGSVLADETVLPTD